MLLLHVLCALVSTVCVLGLDNGLMRTPPMGWLAWERFRCNVDCKNDPDNCISERLFKAMADRLAEDGWRELGYVYVNIDDCWMSRQRDARGRLQADPERFPSGIKALADYVHARGLKLGIYEDLGTLTCGGYPGTTLADVQTDATTFAEWEVDMLKLDGCYSNSSEKAEGYPSMSRALNATGRPIAYSCSWPAYEGGLPPKVNYTQLGDICNLWRNYDDIEDSWDSVQSIMDWWGDHQEVLIPAAAPGRWNDPDMLIVGDFGLSYDQSRAQMAVWAVLAAPYFMSNDLRSMSAAARELLQNRLLIQINQDPLGQQGRRIVKEKSHIEVWSRNLTDGAWALAFASRRVDMPYPYSATLVALGAPAGSKYWVIDVFSGKQIGTLKSEEKFTVSINPSGAEMWYLNPTGAAAAATADRRLWMKPRARVPVPPGNDLL
ncbi:unnamed protein product [Lampetra fluviatilis]